MEDGLGLDPDRAQRVAALRLDNIGDVVLLGPALRALRSHLPAAELTLVTSPAGATAAPLLPWIDDVLVERVSWQQLGGVAPTGRGSRKGAGAPDRALVRRWQSRRFDAAIVFTSFSQSPWPAAYACLLAGIPVRVGQSKEFGGTVLTRCVGAPSDDVHQCERNLHLLRGVGVPCSHSQLELSVPDSDAGHARRLLRESGIDPERPYAVIASGASCPARRWPGTHFLQVADRLAVAGLPPVLVGRESDRLPDAPGRGIVCLAGRTTLPQLAALVAGASLLVCNDSGPMHLGDAFATPMAVLYSGTELESQWRPRKAHHILLRRPTPCSPCYRFECPYGLACLDFSPAEVTSAALGLVGETRCAS